MNRPDDPNTRPAVLTGQDSLRFATNTTWRLRVHMMTTEVLQRWRVYRYKFNPSWPALPDPLEHYFGSLEGLLDRVGMLEGDYFLIGPDGWPDTYVNTYLRSGEMRVLSDHTRRKYNHSVAMWLNFLLRREPTRHWYEATSKDIDDCKFWRMTDKRNPWRVEGTTWNGDLAALSAFYTWMADNHSIRNPITLRKLHSWHRSPTSLSDTHKSDGSEKKAAASAGSRNRNVKWFTPNAVRRWVDLGLRGLGPDGLDAPVWRGRNDERDAAFADLLYGTGLRLQEAGSLLIDELPPRDPNHSIYTCRLADSCAKRCLGRDYWMPRSVRKELDRYIGPEGERWRAVARAQHAGRYDNLPNLDVISSVHGDRWGIWHRDTDTISYESLNTLGPEARRRLFKRTPCGLEPLALWLNEDGLPRAHHAWENTFKIANHRIQQLATKNSQLGITNFVCRPHKLRHSFAFKWYVTGRLLYEPTLGYLTEGELRAFRDQFGNVWDLVRTLLGHRDLMTTMYIYLEPFRALDIEVLFGIVQQLDPDTLDVIYRHDARIRTDPWENL